MIAAPLGAQDRQAFDAEWLRIQSLLQTAQGEERQHAVEDWIELLHQLDQNGQQGDLLFPLAYRLGHELHRGSDWGMAAWAYALAGQNATPNYRQRSYLNAVNCFRTARDFSGVLASCAEARKVEPPTAREQAHYRFLQAEASYYLGRSQAALVFLDELEDSLQAKAAETTRYRARSLALRGRIFADRQDEGQAFQYLERALALAEQVERDSESGAGQLINAVRRDLIEGLARSSSARRTLDYLDAFLIDQANLARDPELHDFYMVARANATLQLLPEVHEGVTPRQALEQALSRPLGPVYARRAHLLLARLEILEGHYKAALATLTRVEQQGLAQGHGLRSESRLEHAALLSLCVRNLGEAEDLDLLSLRDRLLMHFEDLLRSRQEVDGGEAGVGLLVFDAHRNLLTELGLLEIRLRGEAEGAAKALEHFGRYSGQGSLLERLEGTTRATMTDMRRALPEGHGVLVYFPAVNPESLVLAVDRHGVVADCIASEDAFRNRRRRVQATLERGIGMGERITDSTAREYHAGAKALADQLLPGRVAERLKGWSHVSLLGSESLGYVPFEWLPLGGEPYLGANRTLVTWPSWQVWSRLRAREGVFATDYLLVTGAQPSAELTASNPKLSWIRLSREHRAALADPFLPRSRVLEEGQAHPAGLLGALKGGVRILHVLAHGYMDGSQARPASIVLSPNKGSDGLLRCTDIEALEASLGLVVLSTCDSGFAFPRRGDPQSGDLAGAWLTAGARAVLVSHSKLKLGAVLESSPPVLDSIRKGASPAEALRRQRAQLTEELGQLAPFRYGMLQLVGDGQRALFP